MGKYNFVTKFNYFYYNKIFLKNKKIYKMVKNISFSSHCQDKYELIKKNEDAYNLEDTFIRSIRKMNNTSLVYTSEDINKNGMNNKYLWELIYNRAKEIKNSFSINEIVVLFHAYCNSLSYDINCMQIINFFWDLLNNKMNNLNYSSLLALYSCAEKTKNSQKIKEISNILLKYMLDHPSEMKLTEKGLNIILKICIYNSNDNIDNKSVINISNHIQNVDLKDVKTAMLCLHFFLIFNSFGEPFVNLLKKIQSLLIFKKINPYIVLKYLYLLTNINNHPIAIKEVKNTISIIYLLHRANNNS
ncbi:conserved Plasmodium protein, unknown function [Plasmodium berghei]|uniref:Uncharacterized protein n=2 Tax=Plasmodium berghei TaxID=5821 RepID=A0A509AEE1_PLABA|nr:conserved Plasmodium protein, unknown function [Plasmodium berghei ANKA]CXH95615.1 conserved Plasmodium protein, unknown function [Plasmodium berghei]SCL91038.1 conserved Plasmodium protein, unknown function [Plasmodium berghei]SCM15411.1 conserved Plasmodium protein, unknown function [Plasmodium berghei]SCM17206.1 conserved Plasmodium protein, unknown function [Plasmodium berghei]SCN22274.1 conserved Plasmodium protein, unknown function [Plasmodium berghei]|eukprot:XP_034419996.1 conserved Plasmodium protein, unknown function [Plasmodium berghei ANKA]